jgi:hypothetical protein
LLNYCLARPSIITEDLRAAIAEHRKPGQTLAALRASLTGAGYTVSVATLHRYLKRPPTATGFAERAASVLARVPPEIESEAAAALGGDDVQRLVRARDAVELALLEWRPYLGSDPRAVRASATLNHMLVELAAAIAALAPPPAADPESDPAHLAAKARLLARVDEVLARGA